MGRADRRYDIDWIRVIAFDILMLYHVAMFFVPWPFLLKNEPTLPGLEAPMLFVNQWRLPLLFVVSGMGTCFALGKRSLVQYVRERSIRLLLPLCFGMLVVIPPQVYVERLAQGDFFASYASFYGQLFNGIYPVGNFSWHHLWFLPYLWVMSMAAIPLLLAYQFVPKFKRVLAHLYSGELVWLLLPVLLLALFESVLRPHFPITYALWGDWYAVALYFTFFIVGFLWAAGGQAFFTFVAKSWPVALVLGILSFAGLINSSCSGNGLSLAFLVSVNRMAWVLAILGLAAVFLNRDSALLSYRNQAVYPFYILHQSVMLVIAYCIMDAPYPVWIKFIILLGGMFGITWLLYHCLIRRIQWLRPFFGLKPKVS